MLIQINRLKAGKQRKKSGPSKQPSRLRYYRRGGNAAGLAFMGMALGTMGAIAAQQNYGCGYGPYYGGGPYYYGGGPYYYGRPYYGRRYYVPY